MLILNSLKIYAEGDSTCVSFTGDNNNDSVKILYSDIVLANEKLIERKYLIEENKILNDISCYKDSIIYVHERIFSEQDSIIKDKNIKLNKANKKININRYISGGLLILIIAIIWM